MSEVSNEARARSSVNAIFSAQEGTAGKCSLFTYNMAYYFVNGQMKEPFKGCPGDMGTDGYYNGLINNLGYQLSVNRNNLTENELKNAIMNGTYPPGSVICYKSNVIKPQYDNPSGRSYYQYGHTQFYCGGNKTRGSSFPSSLRDNYGSYFVYDSKNSDDWQYKVFTPSGTTNLLYCEQEYVPTIEWPVGNKPLPNGTINYQSTTEFYRGIYSTQTTAQSQARCRQVVNKLMQECGLSKRAACAFAGVLWRESEFNPTICSMNKDNWDFGLAQWTTPYGRQQSLWLFCGSNKQDFVDFDKQLNFIVYELKNIYKSPVNGNPFNYTKVVPAIRQLDMLNKPLKELCWRIVANYEMGGEWKDKPFKESYYKDNVLHVKDRTGFAEQAMTLVG